MGPWPRRPERRRTSASAPDPWPRLYAILDADLARTRKIPPPDLVAAWLAAGVRLIQLRAKTLAFGPMTELAQVLRAQCAAGGATFIVNDRVDVALLAKADGVHLGQGDMPVQEARRLLPGGLIGLSTHNAAQVAESRDALVDYVAIGPVFETATKGAHADPVVGLAGVGGAAAIAGSRPLVAIGGITLDSAPRVIAAGASSVAVISDLVTSDWRDRARAYLTVLAPGNEPV